MSRETTCNFLVIGSDGLLGRQLFTRLTQAGEAVWGTTRRQNPADSRRICLDLGVPLPRLSLQKPVHYAFVCAAVTSMDACEADPAGTRRVNVTNTLQIAEQLLDQGCYVQFLSTNAVFDGTMAYPMEQTPPCAGIEYGRQKAEVEARLLALDRGRGLVAISRISKVIASRMPVIRRFLEGLTRGKQIEAFSDLRLSPISVDYALSSLIAVARQRNEGIFHFSGESELSYADLARALVRHLGLSDSSVVPVSSGDRGAIPVFRPAHPALGMARTREILAISPQPLNQAIATLLCIDPSSAT